ncbi:MAG: phage holin family protein [Bacteroidota bacterium]
MRFLVRLVLSAAAVMLASFLLAGVAIEGFFAAILVAAILGFLNAVVRPILIILTIPITIVTLGLFLLVVNAAIILLTDALISGFKVDGFWWALLFSLVLTGLTTILGGLEAATRRKGRISNRQD